MRQPRIAAVYALPFIAALATIFASQPAGRLAHPTDYAVYQRIAAMLLSGKTDIYGPFDGLPFTYPPFAAALFALLEFCFQGVFPWVILLSSVLVTVYMVVYLVRWVWPTLQGAGLVAACTVATTAVAASEPFFRNYGLGQVNILLTGLVFCAIVNTTRITSGVLVGVAAGIKLTPAFYGLVFLARRDWAAAIASIATGVGTLIAGFLVLPGPSLQFWSGTGFDASRVGGVAFAGNQSIAGMLFRFFKAEPHVALMLVIQLGLTVLCYFAVRMWAANLVACFSIATLGGVLISPVSWSHHWVACIPALAVLAREALNHTGLTAKLTWALLAVGAALPMSYIIWAGEEYDDAELAQSWYVTLGQSSYVLWGMACLGWFVAIGVAKQRRQRTPDTGQLATA